MVNKCPQTFIFFDKFRYFYAIWSEKTNNNVFLKFFLYRQPIYESEQGIVFGLVLLYLKYICDVVIC